MMKCGQKHSQSHYTDQTSGFQVAGNIITAVIVMSVIDNRVTVVLTILRQENYEENRDHDGDD